MTGSILAVVAVTVLLIALSVLVLSLALRGPDWVTAAAVALLFANIGVVAAHAGAPSVAKALPYLLLMLPAVYQLVINHSTIVWGWEMTAMLAFASIATLSAVLAPRPGDSFGTLVQWLLEGVIFFFAVTNSIRSVSALRRCIQGIVLAGAVVGFFVTYQHLRGNFADDYLGLAQVAQPYDITAAGQSPLDDGTVVGEFRSAGMIGEPNFFAMVMICLTPWAAYLVLTSRTVARRAAWAVAGVLISYAVFIAYSRGALIGAGAVFLLLAMWGVLPRKSLIYLAVAGGVAVMAIPTLAARLATIGTVVSGGASDESSAAGRLSEVSAAWNVFLTHPTLGVGPGQFPLYYQRYASLIGGSSAHTGDGARNAHNIILGVAADVGLVGLIGFLLLIGVIVVGLVRARRVPGFRALATTALVSVAVYMACSAFLHLAYARYLWLYLAVAASLINLAARHRPSGQTVDIHPEPRTVSSPPLLAGGPR
jgi:hypothetical protein